MAETATKKRAARQQPGAKLACCLHKSTHGRAATSLTAGEIELENRSDDVLEFEVQMSLLQYLNLRVTGPDGSLVSQGHYGDCFSPLQRPHVVVLKPGGKFVGPVSLLATVPELKQLPGRYTVQAVFEYKELRAVSEPFVVELPARK